MTDQSKALVPASLRRSRQNALAATIPRELSRQPPAGLAGLVLEDHALGRELVADAIGLGEVRALRAAARKAIRRSTSASSMAALPVVGQGSGSCCSAKQAAAREQLGLELATAP